MTFCEIHGNVELSKNNICRKCYMKKYLSGYYKENKTELDANNNAWVKNNKKRSLEIKREWKYRNPEVDRERYERIKNTPEYKKRARMNRDRFNERHPDYHKIWSRNNPDKTLSYDIKRLEKLLPYYSHLKDSWDMAYALSSWANAVKKRDNHTCQNCGAKHRIHAHHILYPRTSYPTRVLDISNGVSFCRDCHEAYHQIFDGITNPNT